VWLPRKGSVEKEVKRMAERIKAVKKYSPSIKKQMTVSMDQLVLYLAGRTGLNEGAVRLMLMELRDAMVYFGIMGSAVKLEGVGTFRPTIRIDGTVKMTYLPDKHIKNKLNDSFGGFSGEIENKDMVGKSVDDLVARWNAEHPDDPIEEPGKKKNK
jgi:hypothetical protein